MPALGGYKEGRAPIRGRRVHSRTGLHQDLNHIQVAALSGKEEGRRACETAGVGIGPLVKEFHYTVGMASSSSQNQGCRSILAKILGIEYWYNW